VVASLALRKATSVQRGGELRVDLQRRVIVRDQNVEIAELQMRECAAVGRISAARSKPQRLVAMRKRCLQLPNDGTRPAAIVLGPGANRPRPNDLFVVEQRPLVLILLLKRLRAIVADAGEIGNEQYSFVPRIFPQTIGLPTTRRKAAMNRVLELLLRE
jgi:hypothetical protein